MRKRKKNILVNISLPHRYHLLVWAKNCSAIDARAARQVAADWYVAEYMNLPIGQGIASQTNSSPELRIAVQLVRQNVVLIKNALLPNQPPC